MAAMDMRRARAIAEQKIKSGQNKGLGLEDLVQQIIAESAGAGAPGTAIGAALAPVTLTPAATAPMQPGVPLRAPKPTTEMLPQPQEQELPVAPQRAARPSRYQPELDRVMANIAVAEQAMAGQQPNVTDQIRIGELKRQAEVLGALVRAEQSPEAEIPEEMRAAMEGRQARITRREELLGEQQARAPFAALLAAGAAGTQGRRGETDVEAITRILQAGFGGYDQSRRGFEEGTENIAEARDQAMIDRYNMQEKAREAARQRALEIMGIGEKAEERAVRNVRLPTQLATEKAQADLAEFKAKVAPEEFATEQDVRRAQAANYREISGGGRGGVDVEGRADRAEAGKAAARYRGYAARYEALRAANPGATMQALREADPKTVDDYLAAKAELEGYSSELERTQGFTPYIGGRNPSVGALTGGRKPPVAGARLAPDGKYYVPDPKRPGKYLQVG
jgi:hypothetical protein